MMPSIFSSMWTWTLVLAAYPLLATAAAVLYVYKTRRVYAHQRRLAHGNGDVESVLDSSSSSTSPAPAPAPAPASPRPLLTIGVFHPYANGGGGGERVLYCALLALQQHFLAARDRCALRILLYTGDDGLSASQLLTTAAERFNLPALHTIPPAMVTLVLLPNRHVLEPERYPRFTLFWQSVAHIRVALAAFAASERRGLFPDVFLDTTGCPFAYLVARGLYACRVAAYVHYPMISTNMLVKVQTRTASFNNDNAIARSATRSFAKYVYYRLFAAVYGLLGRSCTDVVMVNSTWTFRHVKALWGGTPSIVYPPCGDMQQFTAMALQARTRGAVVSVAQFRPEKNHLLQLQAVHRLWTVHREEMQRLAPQFRLTLLGSCRNADDEDRVAELRTQCAAMDLSDHVSFVVNASFAELTAQLASASMGLHTMHEEHFGISVVEMMAAGLAVVANNSGGPAADIVLQTEEPQRTGLLARTAEEYADCMLQILRQTDEQLKRLREQARASALRFSDAAFNDQLIAALEDVLHV